MVMPRHVTMKQPIPNIVSHKSQNGKSCAHSDLELGKNSGIAG